MGDCECIIVTVVIVVQFIRKIYYPQLLHIIILVVNLFSNKRKWFMSCFMHGEDTCSTANCTHLMIYWHLFFQANNIELYIYLRLNSNINNVFINKILQFNWSGW